MNVTKEIVIRLSRTLCLNAIFYRLNRGSKRILAFHNVLPDEMIAAHPNAGVAMRASMFRDIIRALKKRWKFSTDMYDVESVTITFDDGYLNQFAIAGRILEEEGNIPAILFTSGLVIDADTPSKALVVDKLLHWVAGVPEGVYKKLNVANRIDLWQRIVRPALVNDVEGRGVNALMQFDSIWPMAKIFAACSDDYLSLRLTGTPRRYLDVLKTRGWQIGWHTQTHPALSMLSNDDKYTEMSPPPGFENAPFAYPYGELASVDESAVDIARQIGYPCAVSCVLSPNPLIGSYFLPRISLPSVSNLDFEMSGLRYFLKFGRLLPKVLG